MTTVRVQSLSNTYRVFVLLWLPAKESFIARNRAHGSKLSDMPQSSDNTGGQRKPPHAVPSANGVVSPTWLHAVRSNNVSGREKI